MTSIVDNTENSHYCYTCHKKIEPYTGGMTRDLTGKQAYFCPKHIKEMHQLYDEVEKVCPLCQGTGSDEPGSLCLACGGSGRYHWRRSI